MAAVAVIRIGTEDVKGVWRVEWDGENWNYQALSKTKDVSDMMWELEQMEARTSFEATQIEVLRDQFGENAPYPMDRDQWIAQTIMNEHVKKKLGMIVLPIPDDYLFILE